MKIVIETPKDGDEDEIIVRCRELDDELIELIKLLKAGKTRITGYLGEVIKQIPLNEIYYFEAVDNRVFAYCEKDVYEVKEKLYEISESFQHSDFQRISKSVIVNVSMIEFVSPMLGSRLEASLKNHEKVIISRQYVPMLKKKLGIAQR